MVTSPINSGIQAFTIATERVQNSANQIAKSVIKGSPADLVKPLIDLKVAEQQAVAAAKVIQVEKNQVGTLLDILA